MKKLLLLFLFLCSLEVAQAQPGISTAIPSENLQIPERSDQAQVWYVHSFWYQYIP